jgi:hypothetical protein
MQTIPAIPNTRADSVRIWRLPMTYIPYTLYQSTNAVPSRDLTPNCERVSNQRSRQGIGSLCVYAPPFCFTPWTSVLLDRSQWPGGLRYELSSLPLTLELWVRIPLEAWMCMCVYSVFLLFCVTVRSGQGPTKDCTAIDR